jgi:hypothetical protein
MSRLLVLLCLALTLAGAAQKRKARPTSIHVLELVARRVDGTIEIDGRVANTGERALQRLVLLFDILAPGGEVLTTQQGEVDQELLEPGDNADFHWKLREPARSVYVRLEARERNKLGVDVENPGPYTIE